MPESDELDQVLDELVQAFADIGFVANTIRELRRNADRLRPPLVDELRRMQGVIDRALAVL
jgi:hypothetical protein